MTDNNIIIQDDNKQIVVSVCVQTYLNSLTTYDSKRAMKRALQLALDVMNIDADILSFDWTTLDNEYVTTIISRLSERGYAPATVNKTLKAIRRVAREIFLKNLISEKVYARIMSVKQIKGEREPVGRDIGYSELVALLSNLSTGSKGVRDRAIIALLYGAGMRRAEIADLKISKYTHNTLKIIGKGNKQRSIVIGGAIKDAFDSWLEVRLLKSVQSEHVFVSIRKGDKVQDKGISSQAVYNIVKKLTAQAGLQDMSPHDFRRTFAGNALDAGNDIATVARVMGHSDTNTTARYDRRGKRAIEKLATSVNFPSS
jgi:integrase/recombinase XerD